MRKFPPIEVSFVRIKLKIILFFSQSLTETRKKIWNKKGLKKFQIIETSIDVSLMFLLEN